MTIETFVQGELVQFRRTFTVIPGETVSSVTATCTLLDPAGGLHTVTLGAPVTTSTTAAFVGEYRIPEGNATAGLWAERWETEGSLEDAVTIYWYVPRDPVVAAQAAAS